MIDCPCSGCRGGELPGGSQGAGEGPGCGQGVGEVPGASQGAGEVIGWGQGGAALDSVTGSCPCLSRGAK